jgi:hypothetical protein
VIDFRKEQNWLPSVPWRHNLLAIVSTGEIDWQIVVYAIYGLQAEINPYDRTHPFGYKLKPFG